MTEVHVEVVAQAPPSAVFELLAHAEGWPEWSAFDTAELERPAPGPDPDGVGAVRRFRKGRTTSREEVVAYEPDRHLGYVLLSGLPLRDYQADVTLEPAVAGIRITWHSTFQPKVPGTGWVYRFALSRFIGDTARRLAAAAARSSPA